MSERKRGGQPGNQNARGNRGGGAPIGNQNGRKHGGYGRLWPSRPGNNGIAKSVNDHVFSIIVDTDRLPGLTQRIAMLIQYSAELLLLILVGNRSSHIMTSKCKFGVSTPATPYHVIPSFEVVLLRPQRAFT